MRLLTIRSLRGCQLPGGKLPNGTEYRGINLTGMTKDAAEFFETGWTFSIRGPLLLLQSPVNTERKRITYIKTLADFDLGFELDADEPIEGFSRWDSHPAQEKGAKK